MAEGPKYAVVGRGRWAGRMRSVIESEGRSVASIQETRQSPSESEAAYVSRLAAAMNANAARIAWLCVLPGRHVTLMIQATMEAGLHVVVEKPWYGSPEDTKRLQSLAFRRGLVTAVHYEYCVLEEVERWRREFYPGAGLRFGGRYFLGRPDHTGIAALDNLGSHLLAIREWAVPSSEISQVHCAYELPDERSVWIERAGQKVASIDLLNHGQFIVQRFMKKIEAALDGAPFPFDLEFAMRVANELKELKRRRPE
jgi:predicted dehydrogenase